MTIPEIDPRRLALTVDEMRLLRECFMARGWTSHEQNGIYTTGVIGRINEICESMQQRLGIEFEIWN